MTISIEMKILTAAYVLADVALVTMTKNYDRTSLAVTNAIRFGVNVGEAIVANNEASDQYDIMGALHAKALRELNSQKDLEIAQLATDLINEAVEREGERAAEAHAEASYWRSYNGH